MADRRVGKRSMGRRGVAKEESGTCNVCSAPCSTCMHRTVGASIMGPNRGESSGENNHGVVGSQCSVNEDNSLPSSGVNAPNTSNNSASEASNLVNSCHDALCGNAESKETIRGSEVSDDSEVVARNSKAPFSGSSMKDKVYASASVSEQSSKCVEGQEDRISWDDGTNKMNSGYSSNKGVNKESADGSALVSDPIVGGSRKDQDSTVVESSNVLATEVKSQSLHNQLPNHEDRISSERGKIKEKSGGANKEIEDSSVERSTSSGQNGKDEKSSKITSLNKSDERISSAISESESDDSEMVEHDVKVCDICGDAGREDLLAICSRCIDGAEHTYCMREMLHKVPEGDWLCEECKFAEESEKQKQEAKRKREVEVTLNMQSSGKRHADKAEVAPDAKRQAVETSTGSPKKSILPRMAALSREASFKGLDRPRGKLNQQTSFSDDAESERSTGPQPPKGAFLKSNSFNSSSSKPKVQAMDDVNLPRQKTGKDYASLDIKEGFRNVGKSLSSRYIDAGGSSGSDSHAKMPASKVHHLQEGKSSKQLKDRSTEANVSASSTDHKLTSRGNSSVSYANNTRDLRALQFDGKLGSLTKHVSNLNRSRLDNPVASGSDSLTNEKPSASEQSTSLTDCKDELPSTPSASEGLPNHGKKSKEAFSKRQRSSMLSGPKGVPSQKGGQTAEPTDTSGVSDSDLSTTKNIKEDVNKGNRLRAAVDAALRKKPSFSKNRGLEQSDVSLVSNVDSTGDKTPPNQLPSKMPKNFVSQEGLHGGHAPLWSTSEPYKQTIPIEKQFALWGPEAIPTRSVELEVNYPSLKPVMRDWPLLSPPLLLRSSAIPDYESIWQGDLEVQKSRNQSATHSGIQAHLSTLASPKVAEVVNKFPEKISLSEVPRLSTWPAQFLDIGPKEDHIALFFFAKDIESYERNYKPLVDNMIKKDLAMKGNLDNVELLIFASNQLPQTCQRWNMLYFLWGVFRGRKESCSDTPKNTSLPTSNVSPREEDTNDLCQRRGPIKHLEKASSLREGSCDRIETQNRTDLLSHENPSKRESVVGPPSSKKEETALKEDKADANYPPRQATGSSCYVNDGEKPSSVISGNSVVNKVKQFEEQQINGSNDQPLAVTGSEVQSGGQDSLASHRKRPLWEITEPATKKMQVNDMNLEASVNKKLKTEAEPENEHSSVSHETSANDSAVYEEKIMKKSPTVIERIVFPLDLNAERDDTELPDSPIPLGNNNNNKRRVSGTVPNLELALGAEETTPDTMGLLPFLPTTTCTGEQSNTSASNSSRHMMNEEDDDDAVAAASLSLSLSFPSMEPQRDVAAARDAAAASRSEEERKNVNVNTPLFLFRDLPR